MANQGTRSIHEAARDGQWETMDEATYDGLTCAFSGQLDLVDSLLRENKEKKLNAKDGVSRTANLLVSTSPCLSFGHSTGWQDGIALGSIMWSCSHYRLPIAARCASRCTGR